MKRAGEGHYIFIKGKIHQDDMSVFNIYALNAREFMFTQETLLKLKTYIDLHTLIVVDFNTPLSSMDRSSRQKQKRKILKQTDNINQIELTDTFRTLLPITKEYTFFSAPHGYFSKIDYILRHKGNLNKYRKIEIIPCIL